jgi:hypothetical protein
LRKLRALLQGFRIDSAAGSDLQLKLTMIQELGNPGSVFGDNECTGFHPFANVEDHLIVQPHKGVGNSVPILRLYGYGERARRFSPVEVREFLILRTVLSFHPAWEVCGTNVILLALVRIAMMLKQGIDP